MIYRVLIKDEDGTIRKSKPITLKEFITNDYELDFGRYGTLPPYDFICFHVNGKDWYHIDEYVEVDDVDGNMLFESDINEDFNTYIKKIKPID